jgi:Root hair defective 3 GTP-binding protein (RHD3)
MRRDFCGRAGRVQRPGQAREVPNHGRQSHQRIWRDDARLAVPSSLCVDIVSFRAYPKPKQSPAARYDREAERYHQEVYKRKRADLVERLDSTLSLPFFRQIQNIHNDVLVSFKAEIDMGLNIAGYNFADFNGPCENAVARFIDEAREAVITEGDPTWQWADELQLLKKDIQAVIDQLCEDRRKVIIGVGILTAVSVGAVMASAATGS